MKTDGSDLTAKAGGGESALNKAERTLKAQISGMAREFERALPGKIGVDRMMRIVMTAILKNPVLAQCEPTTFFGALLQALQLGLEVNTPLGQAYLIPRRKNDRNGVPLYWECNFQLGYQGLLDLCYRYGKYKRITAEVVYEGDYFEYRYGTSQMLTHIPEGKSTTPTHVWALYELENGGERFVVWTWDEALKHGETFSDSYNEKKPWASPWLANPTSQEEMAKKSVLKALLKYAPKSVELATASYTDERAVIAEKYEEGGESRIRFDVKQLEAPGPEEEKPEMQKGAGPARPEMEPQKAEAPKAPPPQEQVTKPEPAPAVKSETEQRKTPRPQEQARKPESAPTVKSEPETPPAQSNGSGLFAKDEAAALEELYEREQADSGPDFW